MRKLRLGEDIAIWKKTSKNTKAVSHPEIGKSWLFANKKGNIVQTSKVEHIKEYQQYILVKTTNSIYKIVRI